MANSVNLDQQSVLGPHFLLVYLNSPVIAVAHFQMHFSWRFMG